MKELASLGYPVRKVRRLVVRGKTTPLVCVDLEVGECKGNFQVKPPALLDREGERQICNQVLPLLEI